MDHTNKQFDADLDGLRKMTTNMASLVEYQLQRAVDAIRQEDLDLVAQVLADESRVNRMHLQSDLRCHQIIAKRQPIAVDLREILAIMHMNNDLERVGDEAKKIAKKARQLIGRPLPIDTLQLEMMCRQVIAMLRTAVTAFTTRDVKSAASLRPQDKQVDSMRTQLTEELSGKIDSNIARVSDALALIFVVQSLERVGDHAKNIGEYVVTIVEGTDPRYERSR